MTTRVKVGLILFLIGVVGLLGFHLMAPRDEGVRYVVGLSLANLSDPWQQQLYQDLKEGFGSEDVVLQVYDAAGNSKQETDNLARIEQLDVDALVVVPCSGGSLGEKLNRFRVRKIPVVLMQTEIPGYRPDVMVKTDDVQAGRLAGEFLSRQLNGKGVLMEISGDGDQMSFRSRKAGYREAVGKYPGLKRQYLVPGHDSGVFTDQSIRSNGFLTARPSVNGVFAHTDKMAYGAALAFQSVHQRPVIVGVGGLLGSYQGVDLVNRGLIDGTVMYPTGGKEVASVLIRWFNHSENPGSLTLSPKLYTGK